ncbi:hypothetical protein HPB47_018372 [Ixodes persulcatus]|uniref:Uncharacterized protein n=1 Tax=Ixodes persulcatus TaxID=34615 RepID=A0AC60QL42_IXOPE|nr:hypothetical protein HPB47_018372 [Ixodes persulcatus]
MMEDDSVPFPFRATGWVSDVSPCSISSDSVWSYLNSVTHTVRQAHRGWAFKEEGYVQNVRLNLDTADKELGLSGVYVVSAWYLKATGDIVGAHCECVAG